MSVLANASEIEDYTALLALADQIGTANSELIQKIKDLTVKPLNTPDIFDESQWYLTLPSGSKAKPEMIMNLFQYQHKDYFHLNASKDAMICIAPCGGVTTKNSSYPRSELREMNEKNNEKASWSTSSGKHVMHIRQSINHAPLKKPQVVCAQIHDSSDDLIMIRFTGGSKKLLEVTHKSKNLVLDNDYILGTPFDLKIIAEQGIISVYYNDMIKPAVTIKQKSQGCYFKCGCYTQSNVSKGDDADDFGEVYLFKLIVEHTQ